MMKRQREEIKPLAWMPCASAFQKRVIVGRIANTQYKDIEQFLTACGTIVESKLRESVQNHQRKNNMELKCLFIIKKGEEEKIQDFYFSSKMSLITAGKFFRVFFQF